jgi:hypothetical protein
MYIYFTPHINVTYTILTLKLNSMKKVLLLALVSIAALSANAQVLLSQSFNVTARTATPPTGWTVSTTGGTNNGGCSSATTWEQIPSGGFTCSFAAPSPTAHSGSGMAGFNSWDITQYTRSELVTPVLDFSALGTNTLTFWVYNYAGFYLHDSIRVFVNTSPTSAGANSTMLFALDPVYNPSPTGWTQYSTTIPTAYTSTTNYIIFRGYSDYGYDVFFDDVDVTHFPPTPCSGTPAAPSITTAATSTATPICSGSTKSISAVDPNFPTIGGTSYQWEQSASASGPWTPVITGTGGTTLTYTTPALSTSTYYRFGVKCISSALTAYSSAYLVPVGAPQPSTITGNASFCPGDVVTYSVTNVSGNIYTWTLPAGWSGTSTTNSITVTPGTGAGTISVTTTNSCGTSIARTLNIVQGTAPGTPAAIVGSNTACANSLQTYSIPAVTGATSYQWTVPSGWVVSGSSTTNTLNVTTNSVNGTISVVAKNGCGNSPSQSLAITVVSSLANPGVINGNPTPCTGGLYTYFISPVPGAASYQWVLPSGWSGTNTGTSIQVFPGSTGGSLTVTAYSPCATSPTSALSTTVSPSTPPSVTVATSSSLICQNTPVTFTATAVNGGSSPTYIWKKNGTLVYGTGNQYVDSKLITGDVVTATLASSAVCRTSDSVTSTPTSLTVTPQAVPGISITSTPIITICAGTQVNFSTNITGGGTAPTYQWYINNNPMSGATSSAYSTSTLGNQDTVTVKLTSSALCAYVPFVMSNKVIATVNNKVSPSVTASASSTTPTPGMPITFTAMQSGGGSTPGYQWRLNGVDIPGETGSTYTTSRLIGGDHVSVRLQSYDPCAQPAYIESEDIVMESTTSIARTGAWDGGVTLYPNPNSGRFTVSANWSTANIGKRVSVDVLNMFGQTLYHSEVAPDRTKWSYDVRLNESMSTGHYILRLSTPDGMRATIPFVLNH